MTSTARKPTSPSPSKMYIPFDTTALLYMLKINDNCNKYQYIIHTRLLGRRIEVLKLCTYVQICYSVKMCINVHHEYSLISTAQQ